MSRAIKACADPFGKLRACTERSEVAGSECSEGEVMKENLADFEPSICEICAICGLFS